MCPQVCLCDGEHLSESSGNEVRRCFVPHEDAGGENQPGVGPQEGPLPWEPIQSGSHLTAPHSERVDLAVTQFSVRGLLLPPRGAEGWRDSVRPSS